MKVSVVWIEKGKTYGFMQIINPGPSVLISLNYTEKEMKSKILNIIKTKEELITFNPNTWIGDADRKYSNKVGHPAKDLMCKYLKEQISSLHILTDLQLKIETSDLIEYLRKGSRPFKEKLQAEFKEITDISSPFTQIYEKILEAMK